jgi:hypothetical protein
MFFAICCVFIIPDFPHTTKWLTAEQRAYAAWRLKMDAEEEDDRHATSVKHGLVLALKDWRLYIFALMLHSNVLAGTFQYIFPSIVQTLGFGRIQTLLLTVPVWFLAWFIACAVTWNADRTGDRAFHIIIASLVSMVGNICVASSGAVGVRFLGMFLMPIGAVSAFPVMTAWIANSFIRPLVKRASAIAICNAFANASSAYGTFMYPASQEPRYMAGSLGNAAVCLIAAALALALRFIHKRENKKLEALEAEGVADPAGVAGGDRRGVGFRYVY